MFTSVGEYIVGRVTVATVFIVARPDSGVFQVDSQVNACISECIANHPFQT